MLNAFTVDVEDYFQVSGFEGTIARSEWDRQPLRVEANTRRILDLLDEHGVKGTFFILGWVAERLPALIGEIAARGHELGAHSFEHRLVYRMEPEDFRADLRRTVAAIEKASGVSVRTYRAPTFSIVESSLWALDILADEGFVLDSSIFPVRHDRYGYMGIPRHPFVFEEPRRNNLIEFPLTTWRKLGMNLPAAGGGYFRILPEWVVRGGIRQANAAGYPAVFYLHPWEVDPEQPRISAPMLSRLRHYHGLERTISIWTSICCSFSTHETV